MLIPEKQVKHFISLKRVFVGFVSLSILFLIWGRINAFSKETQVSLDELIIGTVEKGDLIRDIRAPGTLVPIELNYLAASSKGRVEKILLQAGDKVDIGTLIMTFENPELLQAFDAAQFEVEVLQANYSALEQRLNQEELSQKIRVADFKSRYEMAKLRQQANQKLLKNGAVSEINYNESILLVEQLKIQHALEVERLQSLPTLKKAQLAAAQAQSLKAKRQLRLQKELLAGLAVKSTSKGILQEVLLSEGELVMPGTRLARIADQQNLKAELRVQESQVKDISKGQSVIISAGGKKANGLVSRINPAVQQGIVVVDVYFSDEMLVGARPDLRVDGVIELEQLNNILKIKRPVFTQENSTSSLFILDKNQLIATRHQVEFGRGSVDMIEVRSQLNEGDRVVVSSTKKYDDLNQLKLRNNQF